METNQTDAPEVSLFREIESQVRAWADADVALKNFKHPEKPEKPAHFDSQRQYDEYESKEDAYEEAQAAIYKQVKPYNDAMDLATRELQFLLPENQEFRISTRSGKVVTWAHKDGYDKTVYLMYWKDYCLRFDINPETGIYYEQEAEERAETAEPEPIAEPTPPAVSGVQPLNPYDENRALRYLASAANVYLSAFGQATATKTELIAIAQLMATIND